MQFYVQGDKISDNDLFFHRKEIIDDNISVNLNNHRKNNGQIFNRIYNTKSVLKI